MSRTVPCNTSSGMARQRFPPVQLIPGPPALTVRMGLTKGSRRPFCPIGRGGAGFFGASSVLAAVAVAGLAGAAGVTGFATTGVATTFLSPAFLSPGLSLTAPPLVVETIVPVATGGLVAVILAAGATGVWPLAWPAAPVLLAP